jgi:protein ImuB
MSVLYCTIPHFATALVRRDNPEWTGEPLILIGSEERVFDVSAEAATCGVVAGMTARTAQVRCPGARLLDAQVAHCRRELETLHQLLERTSPEVEPHGWGAAYVDLGNLVRGHADAVEFCREVGQGVRRELGEALQPALGWDSSKFTAQAAGRRTEPGHLRAVDAVQERDFLRPLPVSLLPLEKDTLQRLRFLGLRTLGQYATLPRAAVWQQFGRAGMLAHRCARGEDERPVVSRWHTPTLAGEMEFEAPLVEREQMVAALRHLVSPLLAELRANLQACGLVRLTVHLDDGSTQERERTFLFPLAEEERIIRTLGQLLDGINWRAAPSARPRTGVTALAASLAQIQDAVAEQLTLFPLDDQTLEASSLRKLQEVERYLVTRFGTSVFGGRRLRRAALTQPGAPLPEWRIGWQTGDEL